MGIRGKYDGTYKQRKDGRWEFRVMEGYTDNGKQNRRSFYGSTPTEARKKAIEYYAKIAENPESLPCFVFSDFADHWLESHKRNIEATTLEDYQFFENLLKNVFGERDIRTITAIDIEEYLYSLKENGKSGSYISKARAMLKQIFDKAIAYYYIDRNPVDYVEKMKRKTNVVKKDSYTQEEINVLFEKLSDDWIGNLIRVMLATGMRGQEAVALEPSHIEPDGNIIHIRQAVKELKGSSVIGSTKTDGSLRDIPVPEFARKYAMALRSTPLKYVCQLSIEEKPCTMKTFRKHYKQAVEATGVRYLSPHNCRHTYVSQMQAIGVDMETIKGLVGHTDTSTTEDYLHVQDSIKQAAVEKLNNSFS